MIRKVLLGLTVVTALSAAAGEEIPDFSNYSRSQARVCFDENFNSDISRWIRPKNSFTIQPHIGVTGSPALSATSTEPGNMPSWKTGIRVIPGMAYQVSFHYRFDNLKVKKTRRNRVIVCSINLKHKDTGAKLPAMNIWVTAENTGNELRFHSETLVIPAEAAPEAELAIHIDWWHNGTFIYDDFTFASQEIPAELQLAAPERMTLDERGTISIRYQRRGERVPDGLEMLIDSGGVKKLARFADGLFTAQFGRLPGKKVQVKATLFNRRERKIIAEHEWELNNIPAPAVSTIDRHHRLILNGTPFMPIGCYTMMTMNDEHLSRIKAAGFNMLQVQPMHSVTPRAVKNENSSANLLAYIDFIAGYDLKTLMFLQLMIPEKEFIRRRLERVFDGQTAIDGIVRQIGMALKGNRNVVGFYLADENTSRDLPNTQILRQRINFADPSHVTTTLTNSTGFLDQYVSTGDILLFDIYPFNNQRTPGVKGDLVTADQQLARIASLNTPFWLVPQGFDWARHPQRQMFGSTPEEKRQHRIPTAEELTSLPLLGAIYGAKGFVFYSYHEIFFHGNNVHPGFSDIFWPKVVKAVSVLKMLEPFIMSTETPAQLTLNVTAGAVRSRVFTVNGKTAIVLVGLQDAANAASGTLPAGKFTSFSGKSKIENGRFTFAADGVNYDVLISE